MLKLKLIDVLIERGRDRITVAVPAHEVRVLRAVHGIEKVREAPEQEGDTDLFDSSAHAEFDRLTRKYRRINAPDPVRIAYPMGAEQLAEHGFKGGAPTQAAPTGLIKRGKKPDDDEKPAKAEKPAK